MLTVLPLAYISHQRTLIRHRLVNDVEDAIGPFIESKTTASHFFQGLYGADLWPLSWIFTEPSVLLVAEKFSRYKCRCNYHSDCECASAQFGKLLQQAVARVQGDLKGLCLECVRNGKSVFIEGNCRSSPCLNAAAHE